MDDGRVQRVDGSRMTIMFAVAARNKRAVADVQITEMHVLSTEQNYKCTSTCGHTAPRMQLAVTA